MIVMNLLLQMIWFCWLHQCVTFRLHWCGFSEYKAAGMLISTSQSEAMILCWKTVLCPVWVWGELLPQEKDFKYFRVMFMIDGIVRWFGIALALMLASYRTGPLWRMGNSGSSPKLMLMLTYSHDLWIVTKLVFYHSLPGLSIAGDRDIWKRLLNLCHCYMTEVEDNR